MVSVKGFCDADSVSRIEVLRIQQFKTPVTFVHSIILVVLFSVFFLFATIGNIVQLFYPTLHKYGG